MTTGVQPEVPIGMQRLSCLPCRKRKSKCDRSQPCSSCVLRSTEKFCYTGEIMDDDNSAKSGTTSSRNKDEKTGSGKNATAKHGSPTSQPSKKRKTIDQSGLPEQAAQGESSGSIASTSSTKNGTAIKQSSDTGKENENDLDRSTILSAIHSIKTTLNGLEVQLGKVDNVDNTTESVSHSVRWNEIRAWLPSPNDAETILDCFFTDVTWFMSSINSKIFMEKWKEFVDGKPVSRTFAALSLFAIGNCLCLAPDTHPASRLPYRHDHKSFIEHGYRVLLPSNSPFAVIPQGTELVQASLLLATYQSYTGWPDACDIEFGKVLRYARAIHLYDEDKWNFAALSDWEVELRRRMALEIEVLDRYLSLHFLRSPIVPQTSNVNPPSFIADDCYDSKTGKLIKNATGLITSSTYHMRKQFVARCAFKTNQFLLNFLQKMPSERYLTARNLDKELEMTEKELLTGELSYEDACNLNALNSPDSIRKACQSLLCYTGIRRQRCTIMRQFLLDSEAPVELRVSALEHAKCIIETVPVLIALSSSPYVAYSPSWCSGHLFCAASTFAIVYLGEEEQQETSAELDWFAGKIFEVLDALSVLSLKDRVAKRCEELLIALCTSKDTLSAKLAKSKTGKRQIERLRGKSSSSKTKSSESSSKIRKETWPGFRSVIPDTLDNGHVPPAIYQLADAPSRSPANIGRTSRQRTSGNGNFTSSLDNLGNTVFSSPEHVGGGNQTHTGSTSDSRNNSVTGETPDSTTWWPPLDDGQWNALISSLDGDWNSLAAVSNNNTAAINSISNAENNNEIQQRLSQLGSADYFSSLHASMLPTMPI